MEVIKFSEEHIDEVYGTQRAAYKPLFDKYRDIETNPYMETKKKFCKNILNPEPKDIFLSRTVSQSAQSE